MGKVDTPGERQGHKEGGDRGPADEEDSEGATQGRSKQDQHRAGAYSFILIQ